MEQASVFGLHTAQFKKWISKTEANSVKAYFGLNPDEKLTGNTYFYQDGVTKVWVEEIHSKKPRYYIHMIVNFARVLKISNYKVMPYTTRNIRKVFTAINKILKTLPLSEINRKFQDWTPVRFDSVFDFQEKNAALLMQLLNRSVNLSDRKKRCRHMPIPGKTLQESECQSMRFGNNSFTYNIYRKIEEIQDKGKAITEEEKAEVEYLLRVERQTHQDAFKKLLPNMKASDLAIAREDILRVMVDEVALFFGKGDFYSWKKITEKYYPDYKADIDTIENVMKLITHNSFEATQDVYTKNISDIFARLGLSPVGIKKDAVEQYGVDFIQGIYNRITAEYPRAPDKRQYNSFPIPHQIGDGRYKATIILYSVDSGRKQIQVAGKTIEDFEAKVFRKLSETYLINRFYLKSNDLDERNMISKSADYIKRFWATAKTQAAKQDAERFIESAILEDEKKFLKPNST